MAGIYIHIPFCKKICSYCDFYKSTNFSLLPDYLIMLEKELELSRTYLDGEKIETIYMGGGTPSVLNIRQINQIISKINQIHSISSDCEITLETNPDDLEIQYLHQLEYETPVNRISIGIQSFNNDDLKLLSRRHTAIQAISSMENARNAGFDNISIDLIYGLPNMSTQSWQKNLEIAFAAGIKHLSAYHLTIEPKTAFARMVSKGIIQSVTEEESQMQFLMLRKKATEEGFIHYEISNLAKKGFFSQHNSNYWLQKKYLGIGASAHSYNIKSRHWNVSNVRKYIDAVNKNLPYFEIESLDSKTRFNEYLMLSLRTIWGINMEWVVCNFGEEAADYLKMEFQRFESSGDLIHYQSIYRLTEKGWLISDYIISRLMR
jgi:oxygen-independent coproporphyrinogen-3 oxidase